MNLENVLAVSVNINIYSYFNKSMITGEMREMGYP